MTKKEYAESKGITMARLQEEELAFLYCEGYDDNGNEYLTLDAWISRKPTMGPMDPVDGGRGAGQYGKEDY